MQLPRYYDFQDLRLTPAEVRTRLEGMERQNVVAFQTRNPLHRAHEEFDQARDGPGGRRHYSSGMYVRLAFSVAAHLNPEIPIVDEVLAAGDAEFQQKCFEKMGEVIKSGRTILLVTHSMNMVVELCQNAMLIKGGRLQKMGPAEEVVHYYHHISQAEAV